jgi:hypothetical protein
MLEPRLQISPPELILLRSLSEYTRVLSITT